MEDSEIIELFWARSEQAVAALRDKHGRLMFQVARNVLDSWEDADECVSDSYWGVWNAIPPERPAPLLAFVLRITRNLALKRRRDTHAQKRDPARALPLQELENCLFSPSAEELCSARELGQGIDRFLAALDAENRVIFMRRYWFSDSLEDIAQLLGLRENAVSVRLFRIRGKLKAYLKKEGLIV